MISTKTQAVSAVQEKSIVVYTLPHTRSGKPVLVEAIQLLESRWVLGSGGTTGLRTWEAALHLATHLCASRGSSTIRDRNVIELGAGTGLVSILASKNCGARQVLATDGSRGVVSAIRGNIARNEEGTALNVRAEMLQWGEEEILDIVREMLGEQPLHLILGADVTYDQTSVSALVTTLRLLLDLYPNAKALISMPVRNEQTPELFLRACSKTLIFLKRKTFEC